MINYGSIGLVSLLAITRKVCNVLGNGANNNAHRLVFETIAQETKLGAYPDICPWLHGVGICQFDKIGFDDTKQRTRKHIKEKIQRVFGVNINQVQHRELAFSPFLSVLFCRLFYMLRPDVIPKTLKGRSEYWKKHYNTVSGKGTSAEYRVSAQQIGIEYL